MTDTNKPTPESPSEDPPGSIRMGRESLSKVFRSDGGSELSSHHKTRLNQADHDAVTGPRLLNEISDGKGPADTRVIDASLPGPQLHNELTDSEGPSDLRAMQDAEGPIVPRKRLEDHHYLQTKAELSATAPGDNRPVAAAGDMHVHPPTTLHLDTYSIHMEDRLARVKASQKETLEKMKLLDDDQPLVTDSANETPRSPEAEPASPRQTAPMQRHLLNTSSIHPSIRASVALHHREIVDEVLQAIASHKVVVIGMGGNPVVSRARKFLRRAGVEHQYLGYGNYLSGWRRRNALKMWTGWPTFPMIFIRGILIGGCQDLEKLSASGEMEALLRD